MSAAFPSTPRRGAQRASHLRHMSNGSSTTSNSRPVTSPSDTGTVQHDPIPVPVPIGKKCILWIHEDPFSLPEVILNLDLFPDVEAGDLMAIVSVKTDSQENVSTSKMEDSLNASTLRERSASNRNSPGGTNNKNHDADVGNRYLFIAKEMPKEMKVKQPHMEVSVARHIADTFHFRSRSQILIITVCFPLLN